MSSFLVRSASGGVVSLLNPSEGDDDQGSTSPTTSPTQEARSPSGSPPDSSSNRRAYPCPSCPKIFNSAGHLNRHLKIHTGEREHVCPWRGCDKRCGRFDNLVQHFRVHLRNRSTTTTNTEVRNMMAQLRNENRRGLLDDDSSSLTSLQQANADYQDHTRVEGTPSASHPVPPPTSASRRPG
ncbi:hypothetical protein DACRYDRAFT_19409 [Dacryopinax primogenitus]|uniref:C2H2-type domain-containing protein n=1 Tax=Dacryopinax primogenitus (strain DJM 731) TaxID=1858805 RepID=M5GGU8_DACPD|nr:uncharacterized protein DACRYDRAFT_19409 [Dacryopinax primogenitus]EJU06113.1 hypothetical protein DACRYDRAFT_19409 [Dacryopinax primogenitus]